MRRYPTRDTVGTQTSPKAGAPGGSVRCVGDGSAVIGALQSALNDPALSDLRLVVRGTVYHVHRVILAIRSPMFRAMLTTGFNETDEREVVIDEFPPEHFHVALEWAYTGQAHMTSSTVLGVLKVADYCQFDDLVAECRQLAVRFVDAENLLLLLRAALHFHEPTVVRACLAFWANHATTVMNRPEWKRITADTLCTLLKHPDVNCNEDVVLASTMGWLRVRLGSVVSSVGGEADGLDSETSGEEGESSRPGGDAADTNRGLVERVLGAIRLGQLSTACLLDHVKPLVESYGVLRDDYMTALEYKLDPDRVSFDSSNLHLQPRTRTSLKLQRASSSVSEVN